MTTIGKDFPVRAHAFLLSSEKRASNAAISPADTLCLDIFSRGLATAMWPARSIGSVPTRQISRKDRLRSWSVPRIDQLRLAWSPPEWVVATSCCQIAGRHHRLMGSRKRTRRAQAHVAPPPNQYAWRHTSGIFKLTIPVDTKTDLLGREERYYAILQFIAHSIPSASRWFPVFERYLKQVGAG